MTDGVGSASADRRRVRRALSSDHHLGVFRPGRGAASRSTCQVSTKRARSRVVRRS